MKDVLFNNGFHHFFSLSLSISSKFHLKGEIPASLYHGEAVGQKRARNAVFPVWVEAGRGQSVPVMFAWADGGA